MEIQIIQSISSRRNLSFVKRGPPREGWEAVVDGEGHAAGTPRKSEMFSIYVKFDLYAD